jgi:hypothetical protein
VGHGADEAEALLDLGTTLTDHSESSEVRAVVDDGYERRTGPQPGRTGEKTGRLRPLTAGYGVMP